MPHALRVRALCTSRATQADGAVVVTTINRTPLAGALAIGAAEHLLGIVPRGTHQYAKFVTPAEVARGLSGLRVGNPIPFMFNPATGQWSVPPCSVPEWALVNYALVAMPL